MKLNNIIPRRLILLLWRIALRLRNRYLLFPSFCSDYIRYQRYSSQVAGAKKDRENLAAMIFREAHRLEKAFSLPEIRPGFGVDRINDLTKLLDGYKNAGHPLDDIAIQKATAVLNEYLRYHESISCDLGGILESVKKWADPKCTVGGYLELDRQEILNGAKGDFEDFALSRWSIRSYTELAISDDVLLDAVRIARKTPSVCNRQAWKAYVIKSEACKKAVLALQTGNRGFGISCSCVIVVTADMRFFVGPGERNESFVDGGMFAMSLLYALHYKGVGVCPLNWMVTPRKDKKLRNILEISPSENVIMMMVVGNIPERVRVAKSARRNVEDFVVFK